ncbi:MAG: MBL fold metallo-hydrolase [Dehalococcoidia bacterium]|nr:MBL fold metallo-hydrolase [Dehalococcoidia bacterium]
MKSRIVFIGSGTSEGVPRVTCLTREFPECPACLSAMRPGSKDRRRNTSLLIQTTRPGQAFPSSRREGVELRAQASHAPSDEGAAPPVRNILIDAGKFFYQSAIDLFPKFSVRTLDAIVLTHAHADAAGGLDDLRDWTNNNRQPSLPIYVRPEDVRDTLSHTAFYLIDRAMATSGGSIAKLQFLEVADKAFEIHGLPFTPLPVWHGRPHTANGYRFGDVCYIPDVSEIPPETRSLVEGCGLLVLDALRPLRTHGSHLTLEQAIEEVRRLRPQRTLFTGMCHDIVHEPVEAALRCLRETDGLEVGLAYDGMALDVDL